MTDRACEGVGVEEALWRCWYCQKIILMLLVLCNLLAIISEAFLLQQYICSAVCNIPCVKEESS